MAPKSTPGDIMARVIDLCQNFESSDMHAFVMFVDHSALSDVKSAGTSFGEKFIQTNPDIGKAFMTFCTSWTTLKEDVDGKDLMHTVLDSAPGAVGSETPRIEVKSELESAYDCDTDVESEPMDQTEDPLMIIIKKESVTDSNMSENCDELGTSNIDTPDRSMKIEDVKAEKEKLYANPKLRHGMRKKLSKLRRTQVSVRLPTEVQCEVCAMTFTTKYSLIRHMRLKHTSRTCDECDEQFINRRALLYHVKGSHTSVKEGDQGSVKEKPRHSLFHCDVCKLVFLTQSSVARHRILKHTPKVFECDLCKEKFPTETLLREHKNDVHLKVWSTCKLCGKKFNHKTEYKHHKKTHRIEKVLENPYNKCSLCEKEYSSRKELRRHESRVHSSAKYPCQTCGKCFGLVTDLVLHEKSHTNEYKCQYCEKVLKSAKILRDHENGHTKVNVFVCDMCGVEFYNNTSLAHHRKRHIFGSASFKKPRSKCAYCSATFKTSYYLSKHLRDNHVETALADKSPYVKQCEVCSKIFISEKFQKHVDMHNKNKRHECPVCGTAFVDKGNLYQHMVKVHKMEKYPCTVCKRVFWSPDEVRSHFMVEHEQD